MHTKEKHFFGRHPVCTLCTPGTGMCNVSPCTNMSAPCCTLETTCTGVSDIFLNSIRCNKISKELSRCHKLKFSKRENKIRICGKASIP